MDYDFNKVEKKWQDYWAKNETFKTDVWDFSKPKYYVLDMFPYPSGQGLHVGHPEGYTATDIVARMKRMQGYNVLHPMGFDAFGLPAEQYAIQTGNHPDGFTARNIATFKKQLNMLGFSYDWSKEVSTSDPKYYKWTQWIFKQLFNDGLAKYVDMPVNWCEELGTVLSNDEIVDGKSERGGYPVVRKNLKQWVIDIPKYAERLLENLDEIDWPESTKEIQRNWIGKSVGANVNFKIEGTDDFVTVFTTRPDTLYGVTFMVLSPEHPIIEKYADQISNIDDLRKYKEEAALKSELERTELSKEKTGVKVEGLNIVNPITNKVVPVYIADYVMMNYGTGAIMAVPAHDQRDYDFAKKFNIPIVQVIKGGDISKEAYTGDGEMINSGVLNGFTNKKDSINKMIEYLEENGIGKKSVNYRIRDWIFARQRYWGEPVPVLHFDDHIEPLDDSELPLVLPELEDYSPSKKGEAPLEKATEWVNVTKNGRHAKRETSTMPGSAGSSWYFLRYIDPNNDSELADKKLLEHWMPVDLYLGGVEHATGHLLYSRMWNNYLFDKGIVPVKEPFKKLVHQGMILGSNGEKMSKSRGNVVNPDDIVRDYGADSLRVYEMFMGPLCDSKPWSETGIEGAKKFVDRFFRLFSDTSKICDKPNPNLEKEYHKTVKKVTSDFEKLSFNTAISQIMIFVNAAYKEAFIPREYAEGIIKLFNPIAPHVTEELWSILGHDKTIANEPWPIYDDAKTVDNTINLPIQINGKLKGTIEIELDLPEETIKTLAHEKVANLLDGKNIVKEIYVKNKIYNIVVK
ncbi:MAG: leucine--tRNA ligase [Clostridia bacterium]|nr:leucine--tRNA ligase [Clostridia bacterium]